MSWSLSKAGAIESALALGLKKTALPEPGLDALSVIALAAERTAFADEQTHTEISLIALAPPTDPRNLLPEALRPLLLRAIGKPQPNSPTWARLCHSLEQHLQKSGYRLHPFDLPKLDKYLALADLKPGTYEYWYLQQLSHSPSEVANEPMDWDNWQEFGKAEQQHFLRAQRHKDAEEARLNLEKDFSTASATLRQIYIEALSVNLSPADRPFLESLQTDRSGKVVELARQLLARFPDSEAARQNQAQLKDWLETPWLSRKINLVKQKGKKASETVLDFFDLIEFMPIDIIAAALKVNLDDLPRRIDKILALPLAKSATFAGRYELALAFLEKEDPDYLITWLVNMLSWFNEAPDNIKSRLAALLTPGLSNAMQLPQPILVQVYDLLQGPLPEAAAIDLVHSPAFRTSCEGSLADQDYCIESLMLTALLLPASQYGLFLKQLPDSPFKSGLNPRHYLAFLQALADAG